MKILALILSLFLLIVAGAMLLNYLLTTNDLFIQLAFVIAGISIALFGLGYGEYYRERYNQYTKTRVRNILSH